MSIEFVIEQSQRAVVEENLARIQDLFNVQILLANGTVGKVWITLKDGQVEKAKSYVQALASPDQENAVTIPASLIKILGPRTDEHFKLESEYGVVICFPQDTKAVIYGSPMNIILASSKLEDLISNATPVKVPQQKTPPPKPNRALEEFALKLGYEQEQINTVFEKLGPTIDKNAFLNGLINASGASLRDDRWSPLPLPASSASTRPVGHQQQPYVRHPSEMVVSKGMGHLGGVSSQHYGSDIGVVSRGFNPRSSVPPSTTQGFNSQDYISVAGGMNPHGYNREMGMLGHRGENIVSRGYSPRTTGPTTRASNPAMQGYSNGGWPEGIPTSTGVLSRGLIVPRTTAQTTYGNNTTYSNPEWAEPIPNGSYLLQGSDYNQLNSDPQVDQMVDRLLTSKYQQFPQSDLRHIVIDGSNVAMSHGNNKIFSCRGIALCVDWFRRRGHTQITVFVPAWRKEASKIDSPITDQHILTQLEAKGFLTFTPSRKVKGRRIVCYDDRFIIRLADANDGVIVSNDNFKDLASENPKWRNVIEQRLLMYSFVTDMFMPPDDPLGRHGPTLDEFLHKGTQTHRRLCPYGRKCTYGTRCKYHHPERETNRLPMYQNLKVLFPNQEALILNVMKKYPQEKDADKLASHILNMIH